METAHQQWFEAVPEGPASSLRAGRIRLHTAPGEATDRLADVGHFLIDAQAAGGSDAPVQCFVSTEYRSYRRAIEEAVREGACALELPAGGITADVRLRFFWMTPEAERPAAPAAPPAAAAAPDAPLAATAPSQGVSYVPDTDERIVVERKPFWLATGRGLFGNIVAALAFLTGVGLVAIVLPSFVGGADVERPPGALPDLVVGLLLLVFALGFLVTERPGLLLIVGALLWMFAGGHWMIQGQIAVPEAAAAGLGIVAGLCAVLLRRRPAQAEPG